jgi:hypothetical protein
MQAIETHLESDRPVKIREMQVLFALPAVFQRRLYLSLGNAADAEDVVQDAAGAGPLISSR